MNRNPNHKLHIEVLNSSRENVGMDQVLCFILDEGENCVFLWHESSLQIIQKIENVKIVHLC